MADQIDLEKRLVHVENRPPTDEVPGFAIKADDATEDSKERTVPIPVAAIPDLTLAVGASFKSGGFVTVSPRRWETVKVRWTVDRRRYRACLMYHNALRDLKRIVRRAKIKLDGAFTLTCLRKSFAQNHAEAGTDPRTLAQLLGGSDVSMTMQYYRKVTDANLQAAAAAQDGFFEPKLRQSFTEGRSPTDSRKTGCA
jgi:integrase